MNVTIFQNEYDAWKEAYETTKRYFMITEIVDSPGKFNPDSIYYIVSTQEDLTPWLLEKADNPDNHDILTRVYSRKVGHSFIEDITNVNNKFLFIGQC